MTKRILLVLGFLVGAAFSLQAGSFQINSQSTKAMSMGGSLTGRAFDASTVFFNPGGISRLKDKTLLNAGINVYIPRTSFLGAQNQKEEDDGGISLPWHIYLSTKLKKESLSAGLSINTPFGYNSTWKEDWSGRYISQTFRLRTVFVQPTIAWAANEHFSIGVGPVFGFGGIRVTRALPFTSNGNEASMDLSGNGTGFGGNVGLYYENGKFTWGLSYRTGMKIKIEEGDAEFKDVPSLLLLNGTYPNSTVFDSELLLPGVISLAAGYTVNQQIVLTAGFNYTTWSVFDSLNYEFSEPTLTDIRSGRNYENALSVRAGIEAKMTDKLTLRGGVALDQSPVPDKYMYPDLPDADKTIIGAGFTYQLKPKFSIDGAFMFENVRERRETDNTHYEFEGTYNSFIYVAGVGIQYQF